MKLPSGNTFELTNARIPLDLAPGLALPASSEATLSRTIRVENGRVTAVSGSARGDIPTADLAHRLLLPRFVDAHTHLDKGHIVARSPNQDGSFAGARSAVAHDREARWDASDVSTRMDFALRCAYAHGTAVIRTHIDSIGKQTDISWPVFAGMRDAWQGRIELQGVALFPAELAIDDEVQFLHIVTTAARYGGILGGLTFTGEAPGPKLDSALDRVFGAAMAHGLDLDFHVDESAAPQARTLEPIARAALRHRFKGRVIAGHCCSLALTSADEQTHIIDLVREAGIAIVSLPMCNMYLQDRVPGRTPRWRGVAPVHELAAAGVPVMIASDNARDPFFAYGDLDMLEAFREATRILQLDHTQQPWTHLLSATPARLLGLEDVGRLAVGAPADFVITGARTINELLSRPWSDRVVTVNGRVVAAKLPSYEELDQLG